MAKATRQKQHPWDMSLAAHTFYLDRAKQPELSEAALTWPKVNKRSFIEIEAFINQYCGVSEATRARALLPMGICMTLPGRVTGRVTSSPSNVQVSDGSRTAPLSRTHHRTHADNHKMGSPDTEAGRNEERIWFG